MLETLSLNESIIVSRLYITRAVAFSAGSLLFQMTIVFGLFKFFL